MTYFYHSRLKNFIFSNHDLSWILSKEKIKIGAPLLKDYCLFDPNKVKRVFCNLDELTNRNLSRKLPLNHQKSLGILILSTSKGLLTDSQAYNLGVGGEIICSII